MMSYKHRRSPSEKMIRRVVVKENKLTTSIKASEGWTEVEPTQSDIPTKSQQTVKKKWSISPKAMESDQWEVSGTSHETGWLLMQQ